MPPKKEPVKFRIKDTPANRKKLKEQGKPLPAHFKKDEPKKSTKAGFVKKEIAKGNLKKEGSKIVDAKKEPKKEEPKKKGLKEPENFDLWDTEVQKLWRKNDGKLPRTLGDKVLYYHDFFNTDGSTTLSKKRTKNYNIPFYVDPDNGYNVGKNRWRDYSWD